jgi:hypothetical protein
VRASNWTRGDLLVAGGVIVALAATADTVRSVYERFALDLAGLSALERVAVALWDLPPLSTAVFAAGAVAVLAGNVTESARRILAFLVSAYAALGLLVLALAAWVGAKGSVGGPDSLGFRFDSGERAITVVTQALGWGSLVALFAVLARRATETAEVTESAESAPPAEPASVFDEMDALWRERLAFGPRRERARELLGRIRRLEEAGDEESARTLAEEMRRL